MHLKIMKLDRLNTGIIFWTKIMGILSPNYSNDSKQIPCIKNSISRDSPFKENPSCGIGQQSVSDFKTYFTALYFKVFSGWKYI